MPRRLTKKQRVRLNRIVSGIYRLFNHEGWRVRLDRVFMERKLCDREDISLGTEGLLDIDEKVITVDFRFRLLPTLVHECLHVLYPDLPEFRILSLEKFVIDNISRTQARNILRHAMSFTA